MRNDVTDAAQARARQEEHLTSNMHDWTQRHQHAVMHQTRYMGLPFRKSPLDAWIYQELLHEIRPNVVVEIGSWAGGSTLYFAHLLSLLGGGTVVSIDIERAVYGAEHDSIITITGDSHDPAVHRQASEVCEGKRVMVCHDGDHCRESVLVDLDLYGELVSIGSYFVVEDGIVDLFPTGTALHPSKIDAGPLAAVEEFLERDDRFVVDAERERYGVTWNPAGFLRRVR